MSATIPGRRAKGIRVNSKSTGQPGARVRAGVAATIGMSLVVTLLVAPPATGETSDRAERENWTLEDRTKNGREHFPEIVDETPLETTESAPRPGATPTTAQRGLALGTAWPDAGAATVTLTGEDDASAQVGEIPVTVAPVKANQGTADNGSPAVVDVQVLDRDASAAVGVDGPIVQVEPRGSRDGEGLEVALDYSGFAALYGGDWASRLRLVQLPECALSDPQDAGCRTAEPVVSTNDTASSTVTARVSSDQATVMALTASAQGSAGDWSATSLSASAAWQVSQQTGDFSWSYPLRVPPSPGGLEPDLGLAYSSGSLDGRVASTNNQSSWVGDGWDLSASGFIERKYASCADDTAGGANNATRKTGDLCWKSDNATMVLGGSAVDLVKDVATGVWRSEKDDGTRIEKLTGAWNTGQGGEHWKVTTPDGTQYFFGRDKRSATDTLALNSAWTVPVFGNNPGEPCYNATFSNASCSQVWRWNLDYVLDTSGNSLTYTYEKETNNYGRNLGTAVSSYVRGGYLTSVLYGTRTGAETGNAPMRVDFTVAERCLPAGAVTCDPAQLTTANASKWPDVPFDLICASATCPTQSSPTFFTRKRLTTVTTKVLSGTTYRNVDSWTLEHQFPDPGDGQNKVLWLASIQHAGLAGTTPITLPKTTFIGQQLANRVDTIGDIGPAMNRYRITAINTEAGATLSVNYTPADCTTSSLPTSPQDNTRRCFPVYWTPEGFPEPVLEYFHKYLVDSVVEDGRDNQSQAAATHYQYVGNPAWHYDDNELTPVKYRTWGQWRGYDTVDVITGEEANPDYPQLKTRYRYFRGMHGDRAAPAGGTRTVAVDGITDHDEFNGTLREQITYNGVTGPEIDGTLNVPWRSTATATAADGSTAHATGITVSESRATAPALPGGKRTTRTTTTYDAIGLPTQIDDQGDISTTADDQCSRLEYARNTSLNILATLSRTEIVARNCATTPGRPGDVISDTRTLYDGTAFGATPTRGLATANQQLKAYTGTNPTYLTTDTTTYDAHGRVLTVTDAIGRTTSTAYTPTTGGPVTKVTTTSPDPDGTGPLTPHVTSSEVDPAWGATLKATDANTKVTTGAYDALGRLTGVWLPGRATTLGANTTYAYTVSTSAPNAVTTKTLAANGTAYHTSVSLYDGLLRVRQTQAESADTTTPGRVVTDQIYDTRGLLVRANQAWFTTGAPSAAAVVVPTEAVPARTLTTFDGAGRTVTKTFQVAEQTRWATTTTYGGDRVSVDPPEGGTPTTTITDARGRTTGLLQYTGAGPTGAHQATSYSYDIAGRLAKVTDPAGNKWTYSYDLLGRQTSASDPDKGTTTSTYDDAGQLLTTTDARGITLATVYDRLGRKTELRENTPAGPLRASWVYDTRAKGQLTSSTRHDGANAYVNTVTGYDNAYRPLGQSVTIPAAEGTLAGTYTTNYTYKADGQLESTALPKAGNMPAETWGTVFDNASRPSQSFSLNGGVFVASTLYSPYGEILGQDRGDLYSTYIVNTYEHGTRRPETFKVMREGISPLDLDITYTRDAAGNVRAITNTPAGNPADTQCFTYDALQRLTQAWTPADNNCASTPTTAGLGGAAPYWTSYTFDTVGNRTSTTQHTTAGDTTSTYTYPAPGTARPHAVAQVTTGTQANTYTYDNAGNTTGRNLAGKPAQTLTWDAEGKLDTITEGTAQASDEYLYTASGDRLLRHQDGTTTLYLPGQEITRDHTGTLKTTRYYTHNGQLVTIGTGSGAAGLTTLISDHHATAELAINNNTHQATRRYHDPYGNPRGTSATWVDDKGFLGKPTDTTGLTHIGARYFDPQIGRFITVDPIMDLTDPQQWQAYAYANNTPVTMSDPTGLLGGVRTIPGVTAGNGLIEAGQKHPEKKVRDAIDRVTRASAPRPPSRNPWSILASELSTTAALPPGMGGRPSESELRYSQDRLPIFTALLGIDDRVGCRYASDQFACMWTLLDALPQKSILAGGALFAGRKLLANAASEAVERAPRKIEASWGAAFRYRHGTGAMTAIEHVFYRHSFDSGFQGVSKFREGTSVSDINGLVDAALRKGDVVYDGRGGATINYDTGGGYIGYDIDGSLVSGIRVHVRDGVIHSAYPFSTSS